MKLNHFKSGLSLIFMLIAGQSFSEHTIYGLDGIKAMRGNASGSYYVQLGSFTDKENAYRFFRKQQSQWGKRAVLRERAKYYSVGIGPFQSAAEVRALVGLADAAPLRTQTRPAKQNKRVQAVIVAQPIMTNQVILDKDGLPEPVPASANWYVGAEGGVHQPEFASQMYINNGSGFAPPFNMDQYTTDEKEQGFIGLAAGRRWQRASDWFPAYSLGLRYNYLFPMNVGRQVIQYNLPRFTNYNYNWKLSSNVFLASGKLNIFQAGGFLPYLQAGAGLSANRSNPYTEYVTGSETPRVSPAFTGNTKTEFAYSLGAGLDYMVKPRFILSAGYEYKNLGHFNSGRGLGDWAAESLSLGAYQTNGVTIGASYLLDR